jgi:hypothetical protein
VGAGSALDEDVAVGSVVGEDVGLGEWLGLTEWVGSGPGAAWPPPLT